MRNLVCWNRICFFMKTGILNYNNSKQKHRGNECDLPSLYCSAVKWHVFAIIESCDCIRSEQALGLTISCFIWECMDGTILWMRPFLGHFFCCCFHSLPMPWTWTSVVFVWGGCSVAFWKSKSISNLKQFESAALNPKCVFVPVKDE